MHYASSAEPSAGGSLDPAGPVAARMADLWWWLLALATLVFVVFLVALTRSLLQRRRPEAPEPWRFIVGGGVVMPVIAVGVVLVLTLNAMRQIPSEIPPGAVAIEVVGHQWWWEVRYPEEDVVTANEIHVPAGRPIGLQLTSNDVIHSFWVPTLGGKIDLLPGRVNTMVLEADDVGLHRGSCAEFCGLQHAKMGLLVASESAEDYQAWLAVQREPASATSGSGQATGAAVFMEAGCPDCHTIRGTDANGSKGPDLTHLAGRLGLAAGTVSNTSENLLEWVGSPHDVKSGVLMPDPELSRPDLEALVAYLETLE
ncbi:MAG: cytochrome c oxidase subunit II [Acidimicrobiia bacterium]